MTLIHKARILIFAILLGVPLLGHAAEDEPAYVKGYLANGESYDLAQHRGKVIVVNFWATWCATCRAELPGWQRVYNERGSDVEMLAISIDRNQKELQDFLKKNPYTIPVVWRFDDRETDSFPRIRKTPTTYFIGRDGKVAKQHVGRLSESQLRSTVESLL